MACVGIDIGGSSVKAIRSEGLGTPAHARVAHDGSGVPALRDAIREAGDRIGARAVDRLGVCLPGMIDPRSGFVRRAANMPWLEGERPAGLVEQALGRGVQTIATDAASWGVGVWEAERISGRLLVLAMGTGIGGAFLINGTPFTLDGFTPGHLGMIDVSLGETDPPRAGDGTPGVLEAYAGGRALLARLGEHADESAIAELAGRMDENDPAIRALAKALRVFHAIYKPDAIRLCGGVGGALAGALPTLDLLVRRDLTRVAQEEWTLGCVSDPFLAAEGVATLAARTHASP